MIEKKFGKIKSVRLGFGGYDDAMFGACFDLGGDGWGVGDFWGTWSERSEGAKWTVADQDAIFAKTMRRLKDLCKEAKANSIEGLEGKPVEVTLEDSRLASWRILTEVI